MRSEQDMFDWLESIQSRANVLCFAKRLAADDTRAMHSRIVGPVIAAQFALRLFPSLIAGPHANAHVGLAASLRSHALPLRRIRAVHYRRTRGSEFRLAGWGAHSPMLDPESTGSIALFAFTRSASADAEHCGVWLCNGDEDVAFEHVMGVVEPGRSIVVWDSA